VPYRFMDFANSIHSESIGFILLKKKPNLHRVDEFALNQCLRL
jgi:hypothetical protein